MWPFVLAVFVALFLNGWLRRRDRCQIRNRLPARDIISSAEPVVGDPPRVSFLLPAWNEERKLGACVEAILDLDYANLEVVLCAGGTDKTWDLARQFRDSRLVAFEQRPGEGKQRALQRCLEQSSGEVICLLDADCRITHEGFSSLLRPIFHRDEDVVTSIPFMPVAAQSNHPFVWNQVACRLYTSALQPRYAAGLSGANAAIRRTTLVRAGGFNADVRQGGDYDLGKRVIRMGSRILHETDASFQIEFHTSVPAYLRQQARWLRNVVVLGGRFGAYREVFSCLSTSLIAIVMLVLPCLVAAMASSSSSSPLTRALGSVWLFGFVHACCSRVRYWVFASEWLDVPFPARSTILLPVFLLIDFVAWAIPLAQYPFRGLREQW